MATHKRAFITRFTNNPYVAGTLPTIGGVMFGCDISSMSGQLSNPYYLNQFNHPDSGLQGGITAAMPAGSFAGALLNSYISDKIGRKKSIILSGWIWVIGSIIQAVAQNVETLVAGRVIAGVAVGIASAIVTVYQAEISKPAVRGRIVSIQQLAIMSGIMIQYFVQYGCSYIDGDASFRLPWALQLIPGLILGTFMFLFPESPRWLMDHDRWDEGLQVLGDIHAQGDTEDAFVRSEYLEVRRQIEYEKTQAAKSYMDLLKPDVRRRVFLGCADQMWSQLSGMNVMMYYTTYIMAGAGLTGRRAELIASSVQYVLGVVFTIPAVIYIDRWGRRPMLLYGAIAMASCLCIVGSLQAHYGRQVEDAAADETTTWVLEADNNVRNAVLVFTYLFVSSFSISWGPCSWTYASEIFPTRVRGKAVSFSTASNWIFNFALSMSTPTAFRNIQYKTYFLYMTFNWVAALHVFFMFPETKGRTLEEMEVLFNSGHAFAAWKLKNVEAHSSAVNVVKDIEQGGIPRHSASKNDLKPSISHDEEHDPEKVAASPAL
ncbi:hypothetical protein JCM6882_005184 [Rhodosporidiobolus microsporus]